MIGSIGYAVGYYLSVVRLVGVAGLLLLGVWLVDSSFPLLLLATTLKYFSTLKS